MVKGFFEQNDDSGLGDYIHPSASQRRVENVAIKHTKSLIITGLRQIPRSLHLTLKNNVEGSPIATISVGKTKWNTYNDNDLHVGIALKKEVNAEALEEATGRISKTGYKTDYDLKHAVAVEQLEKAVGKKLFGSCSVSDSNCSDRKQHEFVSARGGDIREYYLSQTPDGQPGPEYIAYSDLVEKGLISQEMADAIADFKKKVTGDLLEAPVRTQTMALKDVGRGYNAVGGSNRGED